MTSASPDSVAQLYLLFNLPSGNCILLVMKSKIAASPCTTDLVTVHGRGCTRYMSSQSYLHSSHLTPLMQFSSVLTHAIEYNHPEISYTDLAHLVDVSVISCRLQIQHHLLGCVT